ncbi:MAG: hypothetical protein KAG66_21200, partial [Methylococcales bacterium]|nr:hypothetical protein [Methylococcales bacterium]
IFKAQVAGFTNDSALRRSKLIDDMTISAGTIDDDTTRFTSDAESLVLASTSVTTFDEPNAVDTSDLENALAESDDDLSNLISELEEPELPEDDAVTTVECGDVEDASGDYTIESLPQTDMDCGGGDITTSVPFTPTQ